MLIGRENTYNIYISSESDNNLKLGRSPSAQDIPMHVAILSHLLIAFDRMRWLADPLRSRLPSFVCCCATWLTGMIIALPYPIYTTYIDLEVSI